MATLVVGIFALFSRIGSFFTWILAIVRPFFRLFLLSTNLTNKHSLQISTLFTIAAVITSTALFAALAGVLHTLFKPYNVEVSLGSHAILISWLSVACSTIATLFWLFSVCCCSGRSNPHHKSNKGGLWAAEQKGQGYAGPGMGGAGGYWSGMGLGGKNNNFGIGRGRSLRVEKTGAAYERVGSPFLDPNSQQHQHRGGDDLAYGDRVPLTDYPTRSESPFLQQQQNSHGHDLDAGEFPLHSGYPPPHGSGGGGPAYEPFRHT